MTTVNALPLSSWSPGRKLAAGLFAFSTLTALAGAAVYLSGILFLLLNHTDPRQARWGSIVHYWHWYVRRCPATHPTAAVDRYCRCGSGGDLARRSRLQRPAPAAPCTGMPASPA